MGGSCSVHLKWCAGCLDRSESTATSTGPRGLKSYLLIGHGGGLDVRTGSSVTAAALGRWAAINSERKLPLGLVTTVTEERRLSNFCTFDLKTHYLGLANLAAQTLVEVDNRSYTLEK